MASVNSMTPSALPARAPVEAPTDAPAPQVAVDDPSSDWGFSDGVLAMSNSAWSVAQDELHYTGLLREEDEGPSFDIATTAGLAGANLGLSGVMALRKTPVPTLGVKPSLGATTTKTFMAYGMNLGATTAKTFMANGIRVTPTLVAAVLGPAAADGVTMIAPNLLKKYKSTTEIKDKKLKDKTEADNTTVKVARGLVGGAAVGLAAGVVFLLKPNLFKGTGVNFISDKAIGGATHYKTSGGVTGSRLGVQSAAQIEEYLTTAGKLGTGETVRVKPPTAPMARNATFSNRAVLAAAGGLGTLLLANKAAGEGEGERLKWGLVTAAAGAMTVGAIKGAGKMTAGSMLANDGNGGLLAKNEILWKPNKQWFWDYGRKVAPLTALPAGLAASQYFNVVSDFEDITSPRSPFRK